VSCCDTSVQAQADKHMDASITPIDPADRPKTQCAVYRTVDNTAGAVTTQNVAGAGVGVVGDAVTKYGSRTHLTKGKLHQSKSSFGNDFWIEASSMPAFADDGPTSAPAPSVASFTGPILPQLSPNSETTWFNTVVRADLIAEVKKYDNVPTCTVESLRINCNKYNDADAGTIVDTLWANSRIASMFSAGGDSGSVITRDSDNTVVALLNRGGWDHNPPFDLKILGSDWGTWVNFALAYDIGKVVKWMNDMQAPTTSSSTTSVSPNVEVCNEARRPKPATAGDCTSAVLNSDGQCSFPFDCKKNPQDGVTPACVSR